MRQSIKTAAACVAFPLTPASDSAATADGRLGVDVADDATRVLSGANSVKAADVRQSEGVTAMRVASPSTPGANSEAIANGCLGVDVGAGMGRVSPVDVFEDTQDIAVSRSVVSAQPQEYVINHIDYVR